MAAPGLCHASYTAHYLPGLGKDDTPTQERVKKYGPFRRGGEEMEENILFQLFFFSVSLFLLFISYLYNNATAPPPRYPPGLSFLLKDYLIIFVFYRLDIQYSHRGRNM